MSEIAKAAAELARAEFAVFRLRPNDKRPLEKGWQSEATSDPREALKLFKRSPKANIGIATGSASGAVVLDVDRKNGRRGMKSLRELEDSTGIAIRKSTGTVRTPSGGLHYYFDHARDDIRNSAGKLGEGLDIRAEGGYVAAPPSLVEGHRYKWIRGFDQIVKLPRELKALLCKSAELNGKPALLGKIRKGERNNELFRIACSQRHAIGSTLETVLAVIRVVNAERCEPPLPENELKTIAASAMSYKAPPFKLAEHSEQLSKIYVREVETVEYLAEDLLARGASSILAGPPKGMKTTLALLLSQAAIGALRLEWDRFKFKKPLRVGYMDLEQTVELFKERVESFGGSKDKGITARFFRVDEFPKLDSTGLEVLERLITSKRLDLVFIDTLIRVRPPSRGKSATEADADLLEPVTKMAHRLNVHICVLAHTGKRRDSDNPIDMVAATSALVAAVDDVFVISHAQVDEQARRHLHVTGRHIREPGTYVLARTQSGFDLLGEAGSVLEGALQKEVLAYLRVEHKASTASKIASAIGKKRIAVQKVLGKLQGHNLVTPAGGGTWEPTAFAFKKQR